MSEAITFKLTLIGGAASFQLLLTQANYISGSYLQPTTNNN